MAEHLDAGLTVVRGTGEDEGAVAKAAAELVGDVLRRVDKRTFPVRCVLLFATAGWCRGPDNLPRAVREALKAELGHDVPLLGGSVPGFYCSTESEPYVKEGVILVALCSEDLWVTVGHLPTPHGLDPAERTDALAALAVDMEKRAQVRLGMSAERYLVGFLPGIVSNGHGGQAYFDNELHQEILGAFGRQYPLIGGATADDLVPTTGYQFANDECLESGLALALAENDLNVGTMIGHGFRPRGTVRVRVDGIEEGDKGYVVTKLDGKSVQERIDELTNQGLVRRGKRPIFGLPCGPDYHIILPMEVREDTQSIRLNRKVAIGDQLYVLDAEPQEMVQAASAAFEGAARCADSKCEGNLSLIFAFSCTGRFEHYKDRGASWIEALNRIRKQYVGVPIVGLLCAGEFGEDQWRLQRANNMTISMCCLRDAHTRFAETRKLQEALLHAVDQVSRCQTPKEVMQAALEGAVEAGAKCGGQICVVDYAIDKILGLDLGCAVCPDGSPHDWDIVRKMTNRPVPSRLGGEFPLFLRNWSVAIRPDLPLWWVAELSQKEKEKEEDILTFIVRTLHAVLVADAKNPRFLCEPGTIRESGIRTYLAIPLVGSSGKAIATLQIGFPDEKVLGRGNLRLWVGYAQQVAAVLERAQEAEERRITEALSREANRIMQAPLDSRSDSHDWCDSFLEVVMTELEATAAHMRVLQMGTQGEEFHLVGAVGPPAKLRHKTRAVTREGDGSCTRRFLVQGGVITNTYADTGILNKNVRVNSGEDKDQLGFLRELTLIAATAKLPLQHGGEILGSFVVDSHIEYFFTERRQRMVRAAAEIAGAVLRGRTAEYDRMRLNEEQKWILATLSSVGATSAAGRLREVVARLCKAVGADVGSVFIWHKSAKRLVLHTAHNWFKPKENEASYRLGEGWTGSLPNAPKVVSIASQAEKGAALCTKKYYNFMVPPEWQVEAGAQDARVGIRLGLEDDLVGVVSFSYYKDHTNSLIAEDSRIVASLNALAPLITLAVAATRDEMVQQHLEGLTTVKQDVARALMDATPEDGWHPVLDTIREGFEVERATLYYVLDNKRVGRAGTSAADGVECAVTCSTPVEPFGPLGDVVLGKRIVFVASEKDPRLQQWPNRMGVRTLCAVPVICTEGRVRGMFELVNRIPGREHPYETFDEQDQNAAWDVARALAAAIDHWENEAKRRELTTELGTAQRIGATALASAMLMHRIMRPFARIQGTLDWLKRHPTCPEEERAAGLQKIQDFCTEAVQTIQGIPERGAIGLQHESLQRIVREAMRVVRPEIPFAAGVNLEVHNDVRERVHVDVYGIVGALVNLLSNALDALTHGGTLSVSTERAPEGETAIVRIHNTGPSYSEDEVAAFWRPGYTTKEEGHMGLGLAITRRAIEESGGMIEMKPHPAGGIEAVVSLPLAQDRPGHTPTGKDTA